MITRIAGGGERVQVGDADVYEARCRHCYEVFSTGAEPEAAEG